MKKSVCIFLTMLSLLSSLSVAPVCAQSGGEIRANVPFNFIIGKTRLPAGKYTVKQSGPVTLLIRSTDGRTQMFCLTNTVRARSAQRRSELVFNRYGDQYFLSQVWREGYDTGRELPKSRAERELVKQMSERLAKSKQEHQKVMIPAKAVQP